MKTISVVTPCYNEEKNVADLFSQVREIFASLPQYQYEHIFIDNGSTDSTAACLRELASTHKHVKVILNLGNFGPLRSPHFAMLQAKGDAVIMMVADLQDPPKLIVEFLQKWESGFQIVLGVKPKGEENPVMFLIRKIYYAIMAKISERDHVKNFTSYALYDRAFLEILRTIHEPNPYIRGLVTEFGLKRTEISYTQPVRRAGKSSATLYSLYDIAMLGFVNNSKLPLRLATFIGAAVGILSLLVAVFFFILKILYWDLFPIGMAALITGLFFISSVQLFFIGIIGEYVGALFTQSKNRPLVVVKEWINFD